MRHQAGEPEQGYLNILSITSAPVMITGRSSCRYTTSVVRELEWPARRAISSTAIPDSDIRLTNVCRSSLGDHDRQYPPSAECTKPTPNVRVVQRLARTAGEHQAVILPQLARRQPGRRLPLPLLPQRRYRALRQCQGPPGPLGLGVAPGPHRTPYRHMRRHSGARITVQRDMIPAQRPRLLGPDAGGQRQDDVGAEVVVALAARSNAAAWSAVMALDGRPTWPGGGFTSAATLRRT